MDVKLSLNVFTLALTAVLGVITMLVIVGIINFYRNKLHLKLLKSCIYIGRVKHTRLKGGSTHHLDYPLFFTYIDLKEVETIGWYIWPIFKMNANFYSFCSFNAKDHLKGWTETVPNENQQFIEKVKSFATEKTKNSFKFDGDIGILTHLTYFGYCFNPVSFYYFRNHNPKDSSCRLEAVIAEVSNTPWGEMHPYMLHEEVDQVTIVRDTSNPSKLFQATWFKMFHVSPFMEMNYQYQFTFSEPTEHVKVLSKMFKLDTKELWFTASFDLERIPFNPINLLYVLVFYPFHTRIIQIWIHVEALKLFLKGVPTFEHPDGTDVNFGFGITGKGIIKTYELLCQPFQFLGSFILSFFSNSK